MKHNEDMFKWISMLRLRIQIWSTSYYHVICNLFQFVCTWKFNGIYRAFQLLFRPIHGYSVTTNLWKSLKITMNSVTLILHNVLESTNMKTDRYVKYSKTHVLWTHILCELIFYANIHFTRIKDTWYTRNPCENILLLPPFSHFIMFPCKLMTIFDWTVNWFEIFEWILRGPWMIFLSLLTSFHRKIVWFVWMHLKLIKLHCCHGARLKNSDPTRHILWSINVHSGPVRLNKPHQNSYNRKYAVQIAWRPANVEWTKVFFRQGSL